MLREVVYLSKREHTYNSGRIYRAGSGQATNAASAAKKPARKTGAGKKAAIAILSILLIAALALGGVYIYLNQLLDPGSFGRITNNGPNNNTFVPATYNKDVLHLLVIGVDNEEGRGYGAGLGMTDMILYLRYDLKNNELNMLQIPRDSYVGEKYGTGGSGKINALLNNGPDRDAPINNLSAVFSEMFQLPVDNYIAIDMDGFKSIVNAVGMLRVYVPRDMSYQGSSLQQGWRWLDGDAAEFFVRNRHGAGFERSDIDRLDNQRHFYSALFRRFLNLTPQDIVKLLPVFDYYCNTDIQVNDLLGIANAALNLKAENVMLCKVPGATGPELDPTGSNRSMYFIDGYGRGTEEEPGLANLLNQYFRDDGETVDASQLGLPLKIPAGYTLYSPNVQRMGDVQQEEGGADVDVEPQAG